MRDLLITKVYADIIDPLSPGFSPTSGNSSDENGLLVYAAIFVVVSILLAVFILKKVNK